MEFPVSPEPLARRDILRFGGAALTLASPAWLGAVADAQTAASGVANREDVGERAHGEEDGARGSGWIRAGAAAVEPEPNRCRSRSKLSRCREGIRKRRSLASVERFPAS